MSELIPQKAAQQMQMFSVTGRRPCPWCRGVKLSQITHVADDGTQTPISLICDTCGASGPTAGTHEQMAALWDTRN
ncbi:hypothetical protein [Pseudomonas jessenii]|uniref:hypothetical protein n=1 Tax=Pseudomonas jessenii TaxID=77298 RepID=UPI0011C08097|nr:hypothetical protein [Pseudomonas jessenii]